MCVFYYLDIKTSASCHLLSVVTQFPLYSGSVMSDRKKFLREKVIGFIWTGCVCCVTWPWMVLRLCCFGLYAFYMASLLVHCVLVVLYCFLGGLVFAKNIDLTFVHFKYFVDILWPRALLVLPPFPCLVLTCILIDPWKAWPFATNYCNWVKLNWLTYWQ